MRGTSSVKVGKDLGKRNKTASERVLLLEGRTFKEGRPEGLVNKPDGPTKFGVCPLVLEERAIPSRKQNFQRK